MKRKIFMVTIVVILIVATAFMFSGCEFIENFLNNPDKIDQFYNRLTESDSSTFEVDFTAMNMKMTHMIQGNKIYTITQFTNPLTEEIITNESYIEISEGKQYIYEYDTEEETWYRYADSDYEEESPYEDEDIAGLFTGSNYAYDRELKAFKLKEDVTDINIGVGEIVSITITIKSGTCEIIITASSLGTEHELKLTFKDINKTSVNLPAEYTDIE